MSKKRYDLNEPLTPTYRHPYQPLPSQTTQRCERPRSVCGGSGIRADIHHPGRRLRRASRRWPRSPGFESWLSHEPRPHLPLPNLAPASARTVPRLAHWRGSRTGAAPPGAAAAADIGRHVLPVQGHHGQSRPKGSMSSLSSQSSSLTPQNRGDLGVRADRHPPSCYAPEDHAAVQPEDDHR